MNPTITYKDLITGQPTIGFSEVRPQYHYLGASITKAPHGYRVYSGEGEFFASYTWADSFKEAWLNVCFAAPSWPDPGYRMEPSRAQVKRWMWCYFDDYIDDCGEIQATQLVEAYAISHPEAYPWLDDHTHWIWDIPIDIAQQMGC